MEFLAPLIDIFLHMEDHLIEIIRDYKQWSYFVMFAVIFAETGLVVTPFLPGDSLLFVLGSLSAISDSVINVHYMAILLSAAAILGDAVNYMIGKYFGQKLIASKRIKMINESHLEKTHKFFEKHGGKTIIMARFLPIVRTFAPFVAGMGAMNFRKFFMFNVVGGVVWINLFLYAGYLFGNIPFIKNNFSTVIVAIIIISLLPLVYEFVSSKMSKKAKLAEEPKN